MVLTLKQTRQCLFEGDRSLAADQVKEQTTEGNGIDQTSWNGQRRGIASVRPANSSESQGRRVIISSMIRSDPFVETLVRQASHVGS